MPPCQQAQPLTRRTLLITSRSLGCPARAGQRVKGRGQDSESKQQRNQSRAEHEVTELELKCGEQRGSWPPIGLALGYNANALARKEQMGLEEAGEGERPSWTLSGSKGKAPRKEDRDRHTYQAVS